MRVLQLIDALDAGGAERVAVNIANGLCSEIEESFLCATRREGILKSSLLKEVGYLFLNKKQAVDFKAIIKLHKFIKKNSINVIHAHSTSFFLATISKFLNPKLVIIWHDHYGNSEFLDSRNYYILKLCSKYFSHIFSVNTALKLWAQQVLNFKETTYLANVAVINKSTEITQLKGVTGKRIVCLANLRAQKDHITLVLAFKEVLRVYPDWSLHCVGENTKDNYCNLLEIKINELDLRHAVFLYGSKPDVFHILKQAEIGVLASKSEGLPLALLEYGSAKLAVVATKVGQVESLITHNVHGLLVGASKPVELSKALITLIKNENLRHTFTENYFSHIKNNYTQRAQIEAILKVYKTYMV